MHKVVGDWRGLTCNVLRHLDPLSRSLYHFFWEANMQQGRSTMKTNEHGSKRPTGGRPARRGRAMYFNSFQPSARRADNHT